MPRTLKNKKIIIILFLAIAMLTILPVFYFLSKQYDEVTSTNTIDNGRSSEIEDIKELFEKNYAFDVRKTPDKIHYAFNVSDNQFESQILWWLDKINRLSVDLTGINDAYEHFFNKDYYIYYTNTNVRSSLKTKELADQALSGLLSTVKSDITFDNIEVNNDIGFLGQIYEINNFAGEVKRLYLPHIDSIRVLNIGCDLHGTLQKNNLVTRNTLNCNIDRNSSIQAEKNIIAKSTSLSLLRSIVNSSKSRIYRIDDVQELNIGYNDGTARPEILPGALLKANSAAVEYFYIWESSALVPLLRVDGTVSQTENTFDISFWVWFLGA